MASVQVFCFLLLSFLVQLFWVGDTAKCPPSFNCGNLGNKVQFPFTSSNRRDCGFLVIHGCDDIEEPNAPKSIKYNEEWFDVLELDQFNITIRDDYLQKHLLSKNCSVFTYSLPSFTNSDFASYHIENNFTMFVCDHSLNLKPIESYFKYRTESLYYRFDNCSSEEATVFFRKSPYYHEGDDVVSRFLNTSCKTVQLPIAKNSPVVDNPFAFLSENIIINVQLTSQCDICHKVHGGQCQLDSNGLFRCAKEKTRKVKLVVAAAVSASGAVGILLILGFCLGKHFYKKQNQTHLIIEQFLEEHGHLAAKRYSYLEVKKATNNFKNKLGQGAFGSVYKGRLSDGTPVAVKVLTELNNDGEEFINEVSSISVTSHVNIVGLLGFCLEGSKRALIYEYMSNGSIDKFIQKQNDPSKINLQLTGKAIYNIAISVARGLEYLHRGCNTRILHLDIKPHNILLDDDFCPKISDFGLAKICPKNKDSIVSLLGARGTAGYIAPEVFSRNFGGVSHKSDVYSYGMMMLEIVGGRKKMNMEVDSSSEIFMPYWIHQRLKSNQELRLECIKNERDRELIKKIVIVSLWCIQIEPSNRPAMKKVVDMMEGGLELLELPPLPVLSLPPITSTSQSILEDLISGSFYSISLNS